jgi:c-di-AMP phosphodiesterase-like protein
MLNLLTFATKVSDGFKPDSTEADVSFFAWNPANIIVTIILIIIVLLSFFFADEIEEVFFTIVVCFVVFCIMFVITFSMNSDKAKDFNKDDIPRFETWLSEKYDLTDLPDDIVLDLYEKKEVTVINVGTIELLEQGKDTYYVVYSESAKELPVVGKSNSETDEKETNW